MLRAYVDDSKANEQLLVLAGYVAPPSAWHEFSTDWRLLLNAPPAWTEFKMHRASAKKHRARAESFFRVVEKYALVGIICAVEIGPLRSIRKELCLPNYFDNPYVFGIRAIMDATAQTLGAPISFVFDERGEGQSVERAWDRWRDSVPDLHGRLPAKPVFAKSEVELPLQAAEIIAWHSRKHWLKHKNLSADVELSWIVNNRIPCHRVLWDAGAIRPNLLTLRERLLSWGLL